MQNTDMADITIIIKIITLIGLIFGCSCRKYPHVQRPHRFPASQEDKQKNAIQYKVFYPIARDKKFLTLARGLGPAFLRVGGTKGDFVTFKFNETNKEQKPITTIQERGTVDKCHAMERNPEIFEHHRLWAEEQERLYRENKLINGVREVLKPVTVNETEWKFLNEVCDCVGWRLIYGLNLLKRNGTKWDSRNAEEVLEFTRNKYHVNWELGNEPNSYTHKTGVTLTPEQIGKAFLTLQSLLNQSNWWKHSLVLGPDANRISTPNTDTFLSRFLKVAGDVIYGMTTHQYYLNGRKATEADYLSPATMNVLFKEIESLQTTINASSSHVKLWLGETASAYGGGAPGLSDSYIDGFLWLDKLGVTSSLGVDMVIRQTFFGSNYALIDNDFDPKPDYWLTLLYKRLVGNRVLNVSLQKCSSSVCFPKNNGHVRIYAHCVNNMSTLYQRGSVVMSFINMRNRGIRLYLEPFNNVTLKADLYLLQPGIPGNLTSQSILLNGNLLQLTSSQAIPDLPPKRLSTSAFSKGIRIPFYSYGFIVLQNANALACFD